jgi:hypothetical protein
MPNSTRAILTSDDSSYHETFQNAPKRRKTPTSQYQNGMTNEPLDQNPANLRPGIARYCLRSSGSRKDSPVVQAEQQSVGQDHPSRVRDNTDDDESIPAIIGDQCNGSTSPLCHHCQDMFDNWSKWIDDEDFRFPHYDDQFQLIDSARRGCTLCYQFCRGRFEGHNEDRMRMLRNRQSPFPGVSVTKAESFIDEAKGVIRLRLAFKSIFIPTNFMVNDPDEDDPEVDMTPDVTLGEQT